MIIRNPMTNVLNFLRRIAGLPPRSVDSVLSDLNKIHDELANTASRQSDIAGRHRRAAYVAEQEAERALRVASRVNNLIA